MATPPIFVAIEAVLSTVIDGNGPTRRAPIHAIGRVPGSPPIGIRPDVREINAPPRCRSIGSPLREGRTT
ncbi:MAG: hypothetical protein ABW001_06730 [Mycobacterium sp.]